MVVGFDWEWHQFVAHTHARSMRHGRAHTAADGYCRKPPIHVPYIMVDNTNTIINHDDDSDDA